MGRHLTKPTEFIQLYYSNDEDERPLELTNKHMLYKSGESIPVPSGNIGLGDRIETMHGARPVTRVSKVVRKGLFNPLTSSGTIVANGVISSTFSSLDSSSSIVENVMSYQDFFKIVLLPYNFVCMSVSLDLCRTDQEKVLVSDIAFKTYHMFHENGLNDAFLAIVGAASYVANAVYVFALPAIAGYTAVAVASKRK